ncbi:MAG: hypothetical protein IPM13_02555 [Phycisphaerales bacterium]|nr:hypothetical protein [Phycisphaerales bacterium]
MRKTAYMVRCVPRYGFDNTEVRTIDLDLPPFAEHDELEHALGFYFASRGISDAVFAIECDADGYFAVINDEVYERQWGKPLL